jgi:hypothetical protein
MVISESKEEEKLFIIDEIEDRSFCAKWRARERG